MTEHITSLQNERVKLAHALQTASKARRKESKMALEGVRLIQDALSCGLQPDFILYDPETISLETFNTAPSSGKSGEVIPPGGEGYRVGASLLLPVTAEIIRYLSDTETPQGLIGVFPLQPPPLPETPSRILILDAIGDPGNMGTILRSAAAAGVQAVFNAPGSVDAYNPKVLRAGMGAHFRMPVLEASWTRIALYCQHLQVYLADMNGDVTYDRADWKAPHALIIGSEAHGESEQAAQLAKQRVYIPMAAETESLNAAVAASVILFEAARKNNPGWR